MCYSLLIFAASVCNEKTQEPTLIKRTRLSSVDSNEEETIDIERVQETKKPKESPINPGEAVNKIQSQWFHCFLAS